MCVFFCLACAALRGNCMVPRSQTRSGQREEDLADRVVMSGTHRQRAATAALGGRALIGMGKRAWQMMANEVDDDKKV